MPDATGGCPRNREPDRSGTELRSQARRFASSPGRPRRQVLRRRNRRQPRAVPHRCQARQPPRIRIGLSRLRPRSRPEICARARGGNPRKQAGSQSFAPAPPRCGHASLYCPRPCCRRGRRRSPAMVRSRHRPAHRDDRGYRLRYGKAAYHCGLSIVNGRYRKPAMESLGNSDNSSTLMHGAAGPGVQMAIMVPTIKPVNFSQTWTFFEGDWHEGNVPIMGPRTHAAWLASTVFDGARAFEGVAPDLDRHCERVNQSAVNFKLKPVVDAETWLGLAREGIARFDANAELYIRPMYWPQTGSGGGVLFDPETTNWCLCIYVAPMPPPTGSAITLSPFRRPTMETAPVDCKAACLYPNNSRALIEAQARGFNNALMLDMLGNVAEFGNSNVFMAKDGVVYTPAPNGTFLAGITRQRVINLLRGDGVSVVEATLRYPDFQGADEIFSSGNFAKVAPIIRIDDRSLPSGPFYSRARKLYWDFAHARP